MLTAGHCEWTSPWKACFSTGGCVTIADTARVAPGVDLSVMLLLEPVFDVPTIPVEYESASTRRVCEKVSALGFGLSEVVPLKFAARPDGSLRIMDNAGIHPIDICQQGDKFVNG